MDKFGHKGLSIEYEVTGEGIPLVFLHGMGGSVNQIYSTYEPMEGVQLITLNQQGHGESEADWAHYDFDHLGDDVLALLDHLKLKHALFAGISMGAAVALNIAVRFPERVKKLLLIRNAWLDSPMASWCQKAYADMGRCLEAGGIEAFYKTKGWQLVKEPSTYTRNAFTCTFDDPSCLRFWQKYLILPGKQPIPTIEAVEELNMPVYIVANQNDLCHPFEYGKYLHLMIEHSNFYEIPDKDKDSTGHKEQINQIIREMISSCG